MRASHRPVSRAVVLVLAASVFALHGLPAGAQWLDHPTPNIPRTPDGKPNLSAPAPRGTDGHPDLSGTWTGRSAVIRIPEEALTEQSKALVREREGNYFKDRPAFQCQPTGPETVAGWRRIIQTPSIIAIAYETLRYRLIFMDGRPLEADPERTWMGYPSDVGKATRWSLTASDSMIARGWTLAAYPTRKHSGRPNATGVAPSDSYRSSSPSPIPAPSPSRGRSRTTCSSSQTQRWSKPCAKTRPTGSAVCPTLSEAQSPFHHKH